MVLISLSKKLLKIINIFATVRNEHFVQFYSKYPIVFNVLQKTQHPITVFWLGSGPKEGGGGIQMYFYDYKKVNAAAVLKCGCFMTS